MGSPPAMLPLWLNQLSKIRSCELLVSAARPSSASEAAPVFHSGLLLQKKEGRFSLRRQLLFGRCKLVPGEGSNSELTRAHCTELAEECGRKPKSCQALSHCRFARRSIKMSLSLSCWWLYSPLLWLLVICMCIYKGEYHFCTVLASPWPFSNNNRLNIRRQKPLLGSLAGAKENE